MTNTKLQLQLVVTSHARLAVVSPDKRVMAVVRSTVPQKRETIDIFPLPYTDDPTRYRPAINFVDGPVHALAFSDNGSHLVVVGADALLVRRNFRGSEVRMGDVEQGLVAFMKIQSDAMARAVMSPDKTLIAVRHDNGLTVIYAIDDKARTLTAVADFQSTTMQNTGTFEFVGDQFYIQDEADVNFFTIQK